MSLTVAQLRRFLGTLPPDADNWPVVGLDSDTADLFDAHKLSVGDVNNAPALVIGMEVTD